MCTSNLTLQESAAESLYFSTYNLMIQNYVEKGGTGVAGTSCGR